MERASRLAPSNSAIWFDLGRAQGLRYNFAAAQNSFDKAIRLSRNRGAALAEAARRCQEFGSYEMAAGFFEQAAQEANPTSDVLVTLAELYERRHRVPEAAELVGRALKQTQNHPRALLAEARLKRLAGEPPESERIARFLLRSTGADESTRIAAWYELAAALDATDRYDESMEALLEAKAMQRRGAASALATLEAIQRRVHEMRRTITTAVIKRWRDNAPNLQPLRRLAVLCGHPRSGTTLLEQMLDAHPDVVSAEETHILHDEAYLPLSRGFPQTASILEVLDSAPVSLLRQAREHYFRSTELFIHLTIGEKLLVDKNPALNVLIPAVVRIFPEARFLVALRDPRDVVLSCFRQPLALNPVSSAYLSLEGTITQYLSVMGFWRHLLSQMDDQWLEVRYEQLVAEPAALGAKVLSFLGLPWDDRILKFHEHARKKPLRSPSYHAVVKPIYAGAVGRWVHYRKYLEPYLDKLYPLIEELGYSRSP